MGIRQPAIDLDAHASRQPRTSWSRRSSRGCDHPIGRRRLSRRWFERPNVRERRGQPVNRRDSGRSGRRSRTASQSPATPSWSANPVSVRAFDYDGNTRRGLTARCWRTDGVEHVVAACDVVVPPSADAALHLAAYRRWLGLAPHPPGATPSARSRRPHIVAPTDLDLNGRIDLVVLSVKDKAARCRLGASDRVITLRASRLWDLVPGEIVVVTPRKQWRYAGHPCLSGEIASTRLDVTALGLVPLRLDHRGTWDPDEEYWGETDEPIEEWAGPLIGRGPRPEFEMEQVLPGADPDSDSDPIFDSNELKDGGDPGHALKILMKLCEADLRWPGCACAPWQLRLPASACRGHSPLRGGTSDRRVVPGRRLRRRAAVGLHR